VITGFIGLHFLNCRASSIQHEACDDRDTSGRAWAALPAAPFSVLFPPSKSYFEYYTPERQINFAYILEMSLAVSESKIGLVFIKLISFPFTRCLDDKASLWLILSRRTEETFRDLFTLPFPFFM